MRYFALLDFQQAVLALGFGFLGLVLALVGWGGYERGRGPPAEEEGEGPEGAAPRAGHSPVPPLLIFVFAGVAFCAFGYAAAVWLGGGPVGY